MGDRTDYTPELAAEICNRIALGESLRAICTEESMPCERVVYYWLERHPEFVQQYARAREAQADRFADEIIEIADDGSRDYTKISGELVVDHDHITRSRLRVDARKWAASKLAPKKYGDKVTAELGGGDKPVQHQHTVRWLRPGES